ncbi:cytochrome P450 [Amylostereum chailletii]|nr:cytochrome P450 [Amylostereum chailletii]
MMLKDIAEVAIQRLPTLIPLTAILVCITIPVLAVVANVLRQLVWPRDKSLPPEVFHLIPFLGSAAAYGDDPIAFFFDCRKKYGDVFTFVLLGRKTTVALGAKGNNFVLGGKSTSLSAEDAYKHITTPVFGKDVVFDVPNEVFMEQKKFVKVGLSTDNFRSYVGMIEDEISEYLNRDASFRVYQENDVKAWGEFDAVRVLAEMTILTASRTLQGKEVRAGLDKSFSQLYADLDGGFTPLNFMFPNLPLESYRKRDRAQKKMSDFYIDIIKRRRADASTCDEMDVLSALMDQKYRNGRQLPDHEIAHMMIALLMAGQHTSATTGAWAVLHLANRPDVADALHEEQVQHFSNPDGSLRSPTYDELKTLPILDSVIRETLRTNPPIHSIMRNVRDDLIIPPSLSTPSQDTQYVVPKGHVLMASPAISQLDPSYWHEADKWEPARWNDADGQAQKAFRQYTDGNGEKIDFGFGAVSKGTESPYQPFGAGRHRCIGEQFAYVQLGVLLSTVIRNIEMRLHGSIPAPNYHTMIPTPKTPRSISYRRRQ